MCIGYLELKQFIVSLDMNGLLSFILTFWTTLAPLETSQNIGG
jgi:hypothetical protein